MSTRSLESGFFVVKKLATQAVNMMFRITISLSEGARL